MKELIARNLTYVNGGIWTPTTTIHGDGTDPATGQVIIKSELERMTEYLFFLATQS